MIDEQKKTRERFGEELDAGHELAQRLKGGLRDKGGRVRVEDLIALAATIVGERCLAASGEVNIRTHMQRPGQRQFSDAVNTLIVGDKIYDNWSAYPSHSVCGILHMVLSKIAGFIESDFCSMQEVIRNFADSIGEPKDWGKVPLSLPSDNHPSFLPLRLGYETRDLVDKVFLKLGDDDLRKLSASVICLAYTISWSVDAKVLTKELAIRLGMEMVNGMSKTLPMTKEALQKTAH